jgi:hypothetical protein
MRLIHKQKTVIQKNHGCWWTFNSYDDALRATTPGKQFSGYTNPTIMNPCRGAFSLTGIGPCIARRLNSFACRLHHHIRLLSGGSRSRNHDLLYDRGG